MSSRYPHGRDGVDPSQPNVNFDHNAGVATYQPNSGAVVVGRGYSAVPGQVNQTPAASPATAALPPSPNYRGGSWRDNPNGTGVAQPIAKAQGGGFTPIPSAGAAAKPAAAQIPFDKTRHALLKDAYERSRKAYDTASHVDYAGNYTPEQRTQLQTDRDTAQKSLDDYEKQYRNGPAAQPQTPAAVSGPFGQVVNPAAIPASPNAGAAVPAQPIATNLPRYMHQDKVEGGPVTDANRIHVDRTDPEYRKHVDEMYASGAAGLTRQNAEIASTPTLRPGDTAKRVAVDTARDAGAGGATLNNTLYKANQTIGNEQGMANVRDANQQRLDSGAARDAESADLAMRAKNSSPNAVLQRQQQTATNNDALATIDRRKEQFARGDYGDDQDSFGKLPASPNTVAPQPDATASAAAPAPQQAPQLPPSPGTPAPSTQPAVDSSGSSGGDFGNAAPQRRPDGSIIGGSADQDFAAMKAKSGAAPAQASAASKSKYPEGQVLFSKSQPGKKWVWQNGTPVEMK